MVITRWTEEEKEFLRANYPIYSSADIATMMGRSERSVRSMIGRMNLTYVERTPWTPEEEKKLKELIHLGKSTEAISDIMGRTVSSIFNKKYKIHEKKNKKSTQKSS